eukprot:2752451-Lingulodinium_polyedra.AAC.1
MVLVLALALVLAMVLALASVLAPVLMPHRGPSDAGSHPTVCPPECVAAFAFFAGLQGILAVGPTSRAVYVQFL